MNSSAAIVFRFSVVCPLFQKPFHTVLKPTMQNITTLKVRNKSTKAEDLGGWDTYDLLAAQMIGVELSFTSLVSTTFSRQYSSSLLIL